MTTMVHNSAARRPIAAALEILGFVAARQPKRVSSAIILSLLASLAEAGALLLMAPLLQALSSPTEGVTPAFAPPLVSEALRIHLDLQTLLIALTLLACLHALLLRTKTLVMARLLNDILQEVRRDTFTALSAAEWSFLSSRSQAAIQHALTADSDRLDAAAANGLILIQSILALAILLSLSLLVSPAMTALAALLGLALLLVSHPLRKRAVAHGEETLINRQTQYSAVGRFIAGLKFAKSANAEASYASQFEQTLSAIAGANMRWTSFHTMGALVFQITSVALICAFIYVSILLMGAPFAQTFVFIVLFLRIAPKFLSVHSSLQELLVNAPALAALRSLQNQAQERAEPADTSASAPATLEREIRCADVTFTYGAHDPALRHISITIPAGKITAIIGQSGSGKSTLADILCGLLAPQEGRVLVDDKPLDHNARRAWRSRVAYVPQEPYLHDGDIRDNLRIAAAHASDEDLWAVLEKANAADFVRALPNGLSTPIGDVGARLSGGERQRIAIARGLLSKPLLLVLDEATSALDSINQSAIAATISRLSGITIVVIAHRPSMVAIADWVVALDKGQIVQMGEFEALRLQAGPLAELLVSESSPAEPDAVASAPAASARRPPVS